MAKSLHSPGKFGNAPVNGRYFFVHRASRCVRSWDMDSLPVPGNWEQVSLEEWVAFRKETLKIPIKKRKALHATLYQEAVCKSNSPPPSKLSSTSTLKTQNGKTTSNKPSAKSLGASTTKAIAKTPAKASRQRTATPSSTTMFAPKASSRRSKK